VLGLTISFRGLLAPGDLHQTGEEDFMAQSRQYRWLVAVGIGMVGGLILSGLWPNTPLYAVATDRVETFAIATGPVDSEVEAVYFLDLLTGDLTALVLGKQPGAWSGQFKVNVPADLTIDPQRAKYLMVTGMVALRRSGGTRTPPSSAMCYVADVTSGKVAAYAIPWSASLYAAGQFQSGVLRQVGAAFFRQAGGEPPGAIPGAVQPGGRKAKGRDRE
jgi:hypothetical protein